MIGYGRQSIDQADIDAVVSVLRSDYLTQGPTVDRFEAALAERVGAQHAIAVSSGTAGLHLACLAAEFGPDDIGLTSPVTFAASANCLRYVGAEVRFGDINSDTLALSDAAIEHLLSSVPQAKALVSVHLAGLAAELGNLRRRAGNRVVIEDAAHAIGGSYVCGRPIGCGKYSDVAVFSFHPVKTITTGEGGAVVTNDVELARRLRLLRSHGIERNQTRFISDDGRDTSEPKPWLQEQHMLGFNYRMTDIQAALGLSQLAKLDGFLTRRREIAKHYDASFAGLPHVRIPQSAPEQRARSGHHLYVVLFDFEALCTTRARFMVKLREMGGGSQVHYLPVYRHPYYARRYGFKPAAFPNAEAYYNSCLSLPFYPGLTDEQVEQVIAAVRRAVLA